MNIGLYQSTSALVALERWQDVVTQNISSSQTSGYRKQTVSFSTQLSGELQSGSNGKLARNGDGTPTVFPTVITGISFVGGETQPTQRDLDVAIQGPGFFEVKMPDGSKAYTRNGQFKLSSDRTLITSGGQQVMNEAGNAIVLLPEGGGVVINRDGTIVQGSTALGKLSVQDFADLSKLQPVAGGYFVAGDDMERLPVSKPELLQGYTENSNVAPLSEMVDMVLISRAYEANQKIISTYDQTMQKTLDALG